MPSTTVASTSFTAKFSPSKVEAAYCCNSHQRQHTSCHPGVYGLIISFSTHQRRNWSRASQNLKEIVSGLQDGSVDERQCENIFWTSFVMRRVSILMRIMQLLDFPIMF
ncbi:hypothetical protein GBAR_LOCUS8918 [Geodia barretti]|uniref:Uncharacterized protein n=1 Tax=Geodia barretti TaxID=519541 RepID=A0AA35WH92_GEOBA|nr:hypothetical protein GBAR_LOCUS8918 [Geodia barretti]